MKKYFPKHASGGSGLDESLSLGAFVRKSPFMEGLRIGLKAGIAGAGLGAGYGALSSTGAKKGALAAGLGGLVLGALAGSGTQEIKNRRAEADMGYHMRRLMGRHPGITLPPELAARISAENGGATIGAEPPRSFERYEAVP